MAPETINIVDITSVTITLSWENPPLYSHNGIIRGYTVRVLDASNNYLSFVNVTGQTITLSGLHSYRHYHIAVSAFTTESGPYSDVLSIVTLESGWSKN